MASKESDKVAIEGETHDDQQQQQQKQQQEPSINKGAGTNVGGDQSGLSLDDIKNYRAQAQQKSIDVIRAAEERYANALAKDSCGSAGSGK
ncbi:hypothetical protein Syun_008777 [Stephania yunnanensis]|uniref:Uncharacterized protein n=1 Tax=Stephania yunnanensis TaxID=152371 RepID=A0AAP0KEY5_9MAGN